MINTISIRNFVTIAEANICFGQGLNIITGETGSGKSLIIEAIELVFGKRASKSYSLDKFVDVSIEVEVLITGLAGVYKLLEFYNLISEEDCVILRRVISPNGRTKCFIGATMCPVSLLQEFGTLMLELALQSSQHLMMDSGNYLKILDQSAATEVSYAKNLYDQWKAKVNEYNLLKFEAEQSRNNQTYIEYIYKELKELAPKDNEEHGLLELRRALQNKEKIMMALTGAVGNLIQSDSDMGAIQKIANAQRILSKVQNLSEGIVKRLEAVEIELSDIAESLLDSLRALEVRTDELDVVEARLSALNTISRKHNKKIDQLPQYLEEIELKLKSMEQANESLDSIILEIEHIKQKFYVEGCRLHEHRLKYAQKLQDNINAHIKDLMMNGAEVLIKLSKSEESSWSKYGITKVEFMVRTNPQSLHAKISEVASGGEISRIMLALKASLIELCTTSKEKYRHEEQISKPVIVFDEVDAGVGGAVADRIGKKMKIIASQMRGRQVIAVTHQPQVAVYGDRHYFVEKRMRHSNLITKITMLDECGRINEIARMLSGDEVTVESREAALSLINLKQ